MRCVNARRPPTHPLILHESHPANWTIALSGLDGPQWTLLTKEKENDMMTISMVLVLQAAAVTATPSSYAEARAMAESGKPLVVLVGADWCPACQRMKNSSLPQVAKSRALSKVAYAVVNTDQEQHPGAAARCAAARSRN